MKYLTCCVIAAAVLICSAGFLECARSQSKTSKKNSVAGKVTIKGKPASGITVGLQTNDGSSSNHPLYKATTDQDGRYRINEVPAGGYQVFPIAPAFVVSDIRSASETVILSEGESVEDIDFALVRGGVITGRVTDPEGRPAIEQQVNLLAAERAPNQRGSLNVYGGFQTDDRGIYRMFGITAGRYKVAAGQGEDASFMDSRGRPSFRQSFYTEATDASDASRATVVEVTEGSEATNVDITLGRAAQTFAASGRIVDGESGQPIANARFGMQHTVNEHSNSYVGVNSISNNKGEFKVESLPPGKYKIFLATPPDSELRSDVVPFEIVDQDVNGLVIKSTKGGASLSGTVVLETYDKAVFAKLAQLRIQGYVQKLARESGPNMGHSASINPDGSFRLGGLEAGSVYFSLGARDRNLTKGFTIAQIEREGVVEPRGVPITEGEQITGVRLVVSYGNATVRGIVKLEDGPLPAGARVFLRISRDGDPRPDLQNIQSPQVDSRGHFLIEGIPSGLYYFVVELVVPGVSRARRPVNQQVTVLDDVVTDVTIILNNPDLTPR